MGENVSWSRRTVLLGAGAGAGTATLGGPLGAFASATGRTVSAPAPAGEADAGLERSHWADLVGRRVVVDGPAGRVRAAVTGVEDLPAAPPADAGRFAVELRIDREQGDIAGLRAITIPGRGVATLLVSAVDRGVQHRSFQIVVNNHR